MIGRFGRRPRAGAAKVGSGCDVGAHPAVADRLESRTLLDAVVGTTPLIGEFLAVNGNGIVDQFNERSDWIEVHNPTNAAVNLDGYYLTDDRALPTKWRFPATTLAAGGDLVVFASGRDLKNAGQFLHTNFGLDAGGEFLALVAPDGTTVLSSYDPYPEQLPDVSYGLAVDEEVTRLIRSGAAARTHIPANNVLGTTWTGRTFADSGWTAGPTGVGFDSDTAPPRVPGFTVRMIDVGPGGGDDYIDDVRESVQMLDGQLDAYNVVFDGKADYPVINLGNAGRFGTDRALPNGYGGSGADAGSPQRQHYVMRGTADVFIPAGNWTVSVNSDDGFRLQIPGVAFIDRYNDSVSGAEEYAADDTLMFNQPRGAQDTLGTFTVPAGGLRTTVVLDMHERDGDDTFELSAASGHTGSFSAGSFSLVGNGVRGWEVTTTSSAVPPNFNPLIGTNVEAAMKGKNASAYVRVPFSVDEDAGFTSLRLRMKYDDGFVAYLNGTEVARRNASATLSYNSAATPARRDEDALVWETITVAPGALVAGNNVLAIHGLNDAAANEGFLVLPELDGVVVLGSVPRYFNTPTPRGPNGTSDLTAVVSDTHFNKDRGFYDQPFDVVITTDTPGATIRYTTDGNAPTATTGTAYTGPVWISTTTVLRAAAFKPGFIPSNPDTQTYIFLNDVIQQSNDPPPGFPDMGTGGMHWDYEMDPDVVNDPAYSGTIKDDLKAIPTLSLVMNPADLFGANGIYTNPMGSGVAWERPGSAELIHPDGTREGFQIDAGVRIYGGVNRFTQFPKHTFRLLFKTRYGDSKLKYDLFAGMPEGDGAVDEFDTIILRGNFNKSWPFWVDYEQQRAQYIHDAYIASTQLAMGQPGIHQTFVHLYVNGVYWGLYNPSERPDAAFAASYLGGEKEQYDALNSSEPVDGTKDAWSTLQNLVNSPNVATAAGYAQVRQYLDVDNLIDYLLVNFYGGNIDWDDHNWYAARQRAPGAGYKFFSWDAERTLEELGEDKTNAGQFDKPSFLYARLRENPEFRMLFADHVHKHFFNGGALTPDEAAARYMEWAAVIDRAIVGESARWGDWVRQDSPYTRDNEWLGEQQRLLSEYFPWRTGVMIEQFRNMDLYPSLDAPVFAQHGGPISQGFTLSMTNPSGAGSIYYTLDGSDPRMPGGAIRAGAVRYAGAPVPLSQTTVVKARVFDGTSWSALNEATFTYDMAALRVTEVMYHPAPPAAGGTYVDSDFEFVEIQNTATSALYVGGVRLTGGLEFTFGNLTLAPGQRAVVVRNRPAFESRYGTAMTIAGTFAGGLDDGGDHVRLDGAGGQVVMDFCYDDAWYPQTDGQGFSLVLAAPTSPLLWSEKEGWRPSGTMHGAPGAADPGFNFNAVVVNEVLATAADPAQNFVELRNATPGNVDVSGWYVSDSAADLKKYRVPNGTVIPGNGYVLLTQGAHFGGAFALSDAGGTVYLTAPDPLVQANAGGYRESENYGAAAQGVTFGRYVKSSGGRDFTAMVAPTPGAANTAPFVGPVVINEIMYNPGDARPEYVELYNLTGDAVALFDPANPANPWRFTDGIVFSFPAGATIPALGYALVVPVDPAAFRAQYNVPPGVAVYGPYTGALDNDGERLTLSRPGRPRPGPGGTTVVPDVMVDRITYQDDAPWPTAPDGGGPALSRTVSHNYGNDVANWRAEAGGSPGRLNFDAAAPTADVVDVTPDPRAGPVASIAIRFDEPVRNFDLADLRLTRGGGANLLTASQTLTTTDGVTWVLGNLAGITAANGTYSLALAAPLSGIADYGGNALAAGASETWTVNTALAASVVNRYVFYNRSRFDGNNPAAAAADDGAIATDKAALLPGQTAAFAHYTSYHRGINGVMIDVSNLPANLSAADFTFRVGNVNNVGSWSAAPVPTVTRRIGAGANGSDRVTLVWADGAIRNKWLQVTVKANANTGLTAPDVFYFGNLVGETGNLPASATVSARDVTQVRANTSRGFVPVTNRYDINRDGWVNAVDVALVRSSMPRSLTLIAPTAAAPAAVAGAVAPVRRRGAYEVWSDAPVLG
jgi:hypothetical protein